MRRKLLGNVMIMIVAIISLYSVNAACTTCNETCSPCGGGCTSTNLNSMFENAVNFDATYGNISGWNTSCITDMGDLFYNSDFNQSVNDWDVSNVINMSWMFSYSSLSNSKFNQPLNKWNVSNVKDMQGMLAAVSFNQDISSWDTHNVTDMYCMFCGATAFNQNISAWNTSKVTDMSYMFQDAVAFNQDIGRWDTSKVTDMSYMFDRIDYFNQNLSKWNVSSVTTMTYMFREVPLSYQNYDSLLIGWASRPVKNGVILVADSAKYSKYGLAARNILTNSTNSWAITDGGGLPCNQTITPCSGECPDTNFVEQFISVTNFNATYGNISGWNTSCITNMEGMFRASDFNQDISSWDVSNVVDMYNMFREDTVFNQPIGSWNTKNVKNMTLMFLGATSFNQNLSSWNISNVTNMRYTFYSDDNTFEDFKEVGPPLSTANYDSLLIGWASRPVKPNAILKLYNIQYTTEGYNAKLILTNATNNWVITDGGFAGTCTVCTAMCGPCGGGCTATDLSYRFYNVHSFNTTIGDITEWDTSCITNMEAMFMHDGNSDTDSDFNQDISGWDTSNVTNMANMFKNAVAFNQNISGWDVSKVFAFQGMFSRAIAFNQNIASWNTKSAIYMRDMFYNSSFNQNIGAWNVSKVLDMTNMFKFSSLSIANYNSLLSGWSSRPVQPNVPFGVGDIKYSTGGLSGRGILTNATNLWVITDGGLFSNTAPNASDVMILNVSDDFNCSYTYNDYDTDPLNLSWFRWYKEGINLNISNQVLGSGNATVGNNITCSVLVFDGYDNSTWYNSSVYLVGDFTPPSFLNYSLSANSYSVGSATVFTVNASDNGKITSVKINLKKPTGFSQVRELSLSSGNSYTLTIDDGSVGNYNITSVNITDGNNNKNDTRLGLAFSVTALPLAVGGSSGDTVYVNVTGNVTLDVKAIDDIYLNVHFNDKTPAIWKRSLKTNLVMTSCSIGNGFNCSINQNEVIVSKDFSEFNEIATVEKTDLTLVYGISAETIPVSVRLVNLAYNISISNDQFAVDKIYIFPIIAIILVIATLFFRWYK